MCFGAAYLPCFEGLYSLFPIGLGIARHHHCVWCEGYHGELSKAMSFSLSEHLFYQLNSYCFEDFYNVEKKI